MIPWDTFKTPQDAYEWAKRNRAGLRLVSPSDQSGWVVAVWGGFPERFLVELPVRR